MEFPKDLIPRIQRLFRRLYFTRSDLISRQIIGFTRSDIVLIFIAAGIGLATGVVILLFNWTVEFAGDQFAELFELSYGLRWWQLVSFPFIPAFGGLLVGLLYAYVFKSKPGHGVPEVILASRFSRGTIQRRTIVQKLLTAALSIGSGGGGGREGPIVHVGAAVGVSVANIFRLTRDQSRTLIACGAAAGISGIFNAPIGGVMFVLEVILGDFRIKTFTPVVVSSVAATAFTRNFYGDFPLVNAPADFHILPVEYLFFALLGIFLGGASAYFTKMMMLIEQMCKKYLTMRPALRPAIGGFFSGILAAFFPILMEQSYAPINSALHATLPVWILIVVALLKPVHAGLTTSSGGTGGFFAPALKTGAMLGSAFGLIMMLAFPAFVKTPTAYALAGMGAVLAGTMHAPLTAMLMVIEISSGYSIVLPAMLTAILATVISQRFVRSSIYTWSIEVEGTKIGSYAYLPMLSAVSIDRIIDRDVPTVSPDTALLTILQIFESTRHDALLVVDASAQYRGIIEFDDVRSFMTEAHLAPNLVCADLMVTSIRPVYEHATLDIIMKLFDDYGWSVIPVLENSVSRRAVGIVTVYDAQTYYRKSVAREL